MADIQQLNSRYEKLLTIHRNYEFDWEDIAYYIVPTNRNIVTRYTPGTSITDRLFDAHAIHNNNLLAASMKGAMTNRSVDWFSLILEFAELNEDQDVLQWLEDVKGIILNYLADSNFYAETHQLYRDTSAFGTGCIYSDVILGRDAEFLGLTFKTFGLGDFVIAENPHGHVDTLYRKVPMTHVSMVQEFGEENCPEKVRNSWQSNPYETREVIHCVYPNIFGDPTDKPFVSVYYDVGRKHQLREDGYWQFPYMVPRWDKITGEVYGYGPGHVVLPDVRNLNLAVELDFIAWSKTIDPPLEVLDDGSVDTEIDLTAGATNYTRNPGKCIVPITINPNLRHTQINFERLKESINRAFYTDQLQLHQGPQMTASEVFARVNEMNRILGPVLGRLIDEFLDPVIVRVFHLLLKHGVLPPVPPQVEAAHKEKGITSGQYRIKYESPLARAQRSSEMQAMNNLLVAVGPLAQIYPEIIDNFNLDKLGRKMAESAGTEVEILRTEREVKKIRDQRAEQMAAEAKRQQQLEEMEVAGKAAPAIKELKGTGMLPEGPEAE